MPLRLASDGHPGRGPRMLPDCWFSKALPPGTLGPNGALWPGFPPAWQDCKVPSGSPPTSALAHHWYLPSRKNPMLGSWALASHCGQGLGREPRSLEQVEKGK